MGTFQACGIGADAADADAGLALPPASTFAPTNVQPEQWIKALASAGVTRAVLVVSHGCGFNTFPSRTNLTLADGRHFIYNYSVRNSPWKGGQGDIAQEFVEACRAHKIRPGFYHGSVNNAFLNLHSGKIGRPSGIAGQAVITQDEYEQILLLNLRQLWTDCKIVMLSRFAPARVPLTLKVSLFQGTRFCWVRTAARSRWRT